VAARGPSVYGWIFDRAAVATTGIPTLGVPEYRATMAGHERSEITRVVPARRSEPAVVALLAIVALIGAALWKPWANAPDAQPRPAPADLLVGPAVAPPGAAHSPDSALVTVAGVQPILALDTSIMGLADGHRGWGVAAAYVPVTQIAVATRRRLSSIRPVVDWQAVEPGRRLDIPATAQAVATVGLAITWPSGTSPRDIRLFYRTAAVKAGPELSVRPRTREIPLFRPLPGVAMFTWQPASGVVDPSRFSWSRSPGIFYLPPSESLPTRPRDWLRSGWPAGEYQFRVECADWESVNFRFSLRGTTGAPLP
jgi:hypothetical protein